MQAIESIASGTSTKSAGASQSAQIGPDAFSVETGDSSQFRAALEWHMSTLSANGGAPVGPGRPESDSLGNKIMSRAGDLAGELKKDQEYVSRMLEQATRNADSMQLMKAMMALSDYQLRVQFVSKTASKATSSIDSLTKLQ